MGVLVWILASLVLAALFATILTVLVRQPAKKMIPAAPLPDLGSEFATELSPELPLETPKSMPVPELPQRYDEDRLVLLARDPNWLFAYWEVSATKQGQFSTCYGQESWESSRPVLRLYDVTGLEFKGDNANFHVDIDIQKEAERWYVEAGQPNRAFCLDLGRVLPDGKFVTLLRSNIAHTPRASLSECCDEEWMWLEGIYQSLMRYQFGISSPMLIEEIQARMGKEIVPLGFASPSMLPHEDK